MQTALLPDRGVVKVTGDEARRLLHGLVTADVNAQLPVWRESGVFSEREQAGLELAECFTFISEDGVPDDVYNRVGGILSEKEYIGLSWILVSINAFNRVAIAGRYSVPPRDDLVGEDRDAASGAAW